MGTITSRPSFAAAPLGAPEPPPDTVQQRVKTPETVGMGAPVESCDVEIRVRYAETDAMGYLHHAAYFVYFELGRTELLRRNGVSYREMEERGIFYVVARLECKYRAPARYDDLLVLTTTTERMTPVRVEHGYRLFQDGRLLTEGRSTLVSVGRNGKPMALPDDLYQQLTGAAAT